MDIAIQHKGQSKKGGYDKIALQDYIQQHDVQQILRIILDMKEDALINWLEHLFFPFSKKVARLPSLFAPASHVFNQDFTYTFGGVTSELCVVFFPQRQNQSCIYVSNNPSSAASTWTLHEAHNFHNDFKQIRLTGAGMTYEYIGSEQFMKGYAYQSVNYGFVGEGNFHSNSGAPTGSITSSRIQDSDWYSGCPLNKQHGGYVRFMPKDDIAFFKYYDTTSGEIAEDLGNHAFGDGNFTFSDKDVALIFLFEGLPTNEGPIIKFHFTRGIEALPNNAKQDFYGTQKIKQSKIYKSVPLQSIANNHDKLVTSKFTSHPTTSNVKSIMTNALNNVSHELGSMLGTAQKIIGNDGFKSIVTQINPEAGAILQGLDMGSKLLSGETIGGIDEVVSHFKGFF